MSIHILYLFLNWVLFITEFFFLDASSLPDKLLANIFSHSLDSIFTFWMVLFEAQSFQFW